MASLETPVCDFGQQAPDFSLPGIDGRRWTLQDCSGPQGLLVMFICNHCPYVKAVQDRIVRDTRELRELGVYSVAIMSNDTVNYPEDSFDNMKIVAERLGYPFPYLYDETQAVARAYGAICTPDFFGYNNRSGATVSGASRCQSARGQPARITPGPVRGDETGRCNRQRAGTADSRHRLFHQVA